MKQHIKLWRDATKTRSEDYPICGQANTYASLVLEPGDELPDDVTCKRCRRRWLQVPALQPEPESSPALKKAAEALTWLDRIECTGLSLSGVEIASRDALKCLVDAYGELQSEMNQRELHHFETEQLLVAAGIDPDATSVQSFPTEEMVVAAARARRCSWSMPDKHHPTGKLCRSEGACLDTARAMLKAAERVRYAAPPDPKDSP